jgi:hypothetical protein
MATIRRTKTEITIETTRVTVIRNRNSVEREFCETCGRPFAPVTERPSGSLTDDPADDPAVRRPTLRLNPCPEPHGSLDDTKAQK